VRLTEDRELRRRRLAIFLRLVLLVPVAIAALIWTAVAALALPLAWLAALPGGRVPAFLHRALLAALGYLAQVSAWATLASGRYPWPRRRGTHPVQIRAHRQRQSRWTIVLRPLLALPAIVLASVLAVVQLGTAIGAWFVGLALGRTTEGLRELAAFCLRYAVETTAYVFLLTPTYPRLAPPLAEDQPPVEPEAAQAL
jgi:Domain of unknown function (DUF4389)